MLRFGLVGAGHMGQMAHLVNLHSESEVIVDVLVEEKEVLRNEVAKRYTIPNSFATVEEMLTIRRPDAVVVVTNRDNTYSVVSQCLQSGIHVLSEKPMALSLRDSMSLVELAEAKNVVYKIGFMRRHDQGYQQFAKLFRNGSYQERQFGNLNFLRIHCFDSKASYAGGFGSIRTDESTRKVDINTQLPEFIHGDQKLGYLHFLNVFCHHINLLNDLCPNNQVINTSLENSNARVVLFREESTLIALEAGRGNSVTWDDEIVAYFENAKLSIKFPPNMLANAQSVVTLSQFHEAGETEVQFIQNYDWAFRLQMKDFVASVEKNDVNLINSGKSCLKDMRTIESIWRL